MSSTVDGGDKITPKPAFQVTIDLLIWAIIAIQIIVGIFGFIVLPDTVPIHWDINGQANGYGPKWVNTFLVPIISIGLYVLIRVLIAAGPRLGGRQATNANLQTARVITAGLILFMLVIQLALIAQSLGIGFDMTTIVLLAISALFIFIGNYMGKMRRNFWMGIRTPWTLTNTVVWERTHRLGGWLFVAVGLIGIVCSFIPELRLWGIVVPILAVCVFLYVYSYVIYRQETQGEDEPLSPPFNEEGP